MDLSPDLADCLNQFRLTVHELIGIVNALIAVIIQDESAKHLRKENIPIPEVIVEVLPPMLQAVGSSSYTLLRLSDCPGLQTRDCYSISRSIVETAVNICYIISEGQSAAERALSHARQKSYQDLERVSKIGSNMLRLLYTGRPDPSTVEGLEAEIAQFTSRTGREKGWIDLNIDDRINVVGQHFSESVLSSLHFARFMVYRHSSEVLHGTFFSTLYFFGVTEPSNSHRKPEDMLNFIGQQHMLILFAATLSLRAVIEAFHHAYGFPAAYEKSKSLMKDLYDIPYFNQEQDANKTDK